MTNNIVVGGQYGDEGKGKIISYLAIHDKPEIIARGGVGPNAGHEVWYKGQRFPMRMLSCGFVYENARILIGAGVAVNPDVFLKEVEMTKTDGRAGVDPRATLITQEHIEADASSANSARIGTTKTGCGPAVSGRAARTAKTIADYVAEPGHEDFKKYLADVPKEVNSAKNVLVEGSQGFMLSVYYGTYPFCTSKDTSASSIAADVGLGPTKIDDVTMVIKSYTTRVGSGLLPEELSVDEAKQLGFQEYGTVTGRPRRSSKNLHWDNLRLAAMINGATQIALTKLDVKFPAVAGVKKYSGLTSEAKSFIEMIEKEVGIPVTLIGTGKDAEEIVDRRE